MLKLWSCAAPQSRRPADRASGPCSIAVPWRPAALALLMALGLSGAANAQYCAATATNCGTAFADERISHVTFAGIDNDSGLGDGPAGCYSDFTAITGNVQPGSSYQVTVSNAGPFTDDWCAVWIDWNQDFTLDVATEQYVLTSADASATFTGNITVPVDATLGATRMRVRLCYQTGRTPCGNAGYGEVEDYSIQVGAATTGACCAASGACTQTAPGACAGTYQGLSTACNPNPCGGACCTGPSCSVTTAGTCPGTSVYIAGGVCNAAACTYCVAGSAACGTLDDDERISRVTFNTIDNDSGTGDGPAGCYSDFTFLSTSLFPGQSYPITVINSGVYTADQSAVWIDFNGDFAFGDAASGEQTTLTSADGGATFTGSVLVPAGARLGATRMRVRVMYTGALSPCGNATYGEVEDYAVSIVAATTGACCQASGACGQTTPGACTGTFSGLATSCAPANPCGGACCDVNGACSVTTAASCPGGSVFVNAAVCTGSVCSGSCCDAGGLCTLATSAGTCSGAFGGTNTTCSPSPCPGQSCASPIVLTLGNPVGGDLAASTSNSTITCSTGAKGLWYSFTAPADGAYNINSTLTGGAGNPSLGVFSSCGVEVACNNPCAGTSTDVLQTLTAGQQIVFRAGSCGDITLTYQVTVSVAVVGACCNTTSGACTLTSTGAGGCGANTYMGDNTACDGVICGQGACCDPSNGACTLATINSCLGQFQSVGTTCTVNPCPQPPTGACCNSTSGACTQVFAVNCNTATSTYGGDNTFCDPSGFCPGVGTCCSSLGNCVVRYTADCPGGLTSNAATSCTPGLCPATTPSICENFDNDAAGSLPLNWTSSSTGAGAPWVIDSTQSYSPSNSVFTNDVGTVSSQFLDLPAVTAAGGLTLDFFSYFTTEAGFDGWVVEYSTDGGGSWTDVAVGGSWVLNGYNQAAISINFASPIAGRPAFSGASAVWTERIASIPANPGDSVIIRFHMASDSSLSSTGVWLDNICIGGIQSTGGTGVCCRGATCSTSVPQANCTGNALAGASFVVAASCNAPGNARTPCCYADYNKVNGLEIQDIFDFINDWLASSPYANVGGTGAPGPLNVQNIFDFLNAWLAGGCN